MIYCIIKHNQTNVILGGSSKKKTVKKGGMGDVERETETDRERRGKREGRRLSVRFPSLGIEWLQLKTEDKDISAKETEALLEKQRESVILMTWVLINLWIIDRTWCFC